MSIKTLTIDERKPYLNIRVENLTVDGTSNIPSGGGGVPENLEIKTLIVDETAEIKGELTVSGGIIAEEGSSSINSLSCEEATITTINSNTANLRDVEVRNLRVDNNLYGVTALDVTSLTTEDILATGNSIIEGTQQVGGILTTQSGIQASGNSNINNLISNSGNIQTLTSSTATITDLDISNLTQNGNPVNLDPAVRQEATGLLVIKSEDGATVLANARWRTTTLILSNNVNKEVHFYMDDISITPDVDTTYFQYELTTDNGSFYPPNLTRISLPISFVDSTRPAYINPAFLILSSNSELGTETLIPYTEARAITYTLLGGSVTYYA